MRCAAIAALALLVAAPAVAQQRGPTATEEAALNEAFPETPELIEQLLKRYRPARRAAARVDDPTSYATPLNPRISMGFRGGATPLIHTEPNYPTALAFFDSTGAVWPVQWVECGNPDEPKNPLGGHHCRVKDEGGNSVSVATTGPFTRGGMSVKLVGAPAPLHFQLRAGDGQYVAGAEVNVSGRGPQAKAGVYVRADSVETGGRHISQMLDGITPPGAQELGIDGGNPDVFRAWSMDGKVYLRTHRATLVSPPRAGQSHAPDNVSLYWVPEQAHGRTPLTVSDGQQTSTLFASRRRG